MRILHVIKLRLIKEPWRLRQNGIHAKRPHGCFSVLDFDFQGLLLWVINGHPLYVEFAYLGL